MPTPNKIQELPPWALNWLDGKGKTASTSRRRFGGSHGTESFDLTERFVERPGLFLSSYRIHDADRLAVEDFEEACFQVYQLLLDDLEARTDHQPVRLWNFIPGILDSLGDLPHRYMVFNAGRFRALRRGYGEEGLSTRVATASGVGHLGSDLAIHCLAADRPGKPIENPRQRPAYRYSERFGPLPPCFARATLWSDHEASPWLLVGGTASVRGEESCHRDDLRRQLDETLYNLAAVVRAGEGEPCAHLQPDEVRRFMRRYRELRVYLVDPAMEDYVRQRLAQLLAPQTALEFVKADLCRPELLVEIEGLAALEAG